MKLQLCVLVLLVQGSLAAFRRVTVWKGRTFTLKCPATSTVEWKNPRGEKLFFNKNNGSKDGRFSVVKQSPARFTLAVLDVTFQDGGEYTCAGLDPRPSKKTVELEVLGFPKMRVTKERGKTFIRCSATGSRKPPRISWKFDDGPEFFMTPQVDPRIRKFVSTDVLPVKTTGRRVTVKCLVRHPSLPSHTVMDFVNIGRNARVSTAEDPSSRPPQVSSTSSHRDGFPPAGHTTTYAEKTSTSYLDSTLPVNGTNATEGQTSIMTTSGPSNVTVEGNETLSQNNKHKQLNEAKTPSLLIFLVTCLILTLVIVVVFISVKLKIAHNTWKKDNEVSDPSEESSKSKSSQEEKTSQNSRQKGPFKTAFTQYKVENPTALNTIEVPRTDDDNKAQTNTATTTKADAKETEL